MEHIKNIEIKNFKSIRHAEIKDCRRINVFIGYPNVGKSNILEALSLVSYLKKENHLSLKYFCRFKEVIDVFNDGYKQNDAEVFVGDYVFSLRYIHKNQIDFAIVEKKDYVEKYNAASTDILKNFRVSKDGRMDFVPNSSNKEYHDNDFVVKKYFFDTKATQPDNINNQTVLSFPFGRNLSDVIRYNSALRKDCGELFSIYGLKLIFDEDQDIVIQKQLDEYTAFQFSFTQIADTLQRLIFYKAAIASNENAILLFEEPEAHMFPPFMRKFTSDVIFNKTNQFFISTHSPYVLGELIQELKDDLSVYVVDYDKRETIIKRLSNNEVTEVSQYGIDLFFNLESYLDRYGQPRSA